MGWQDAGRRMGRRCQRCQVLEGILGKPCVLRVETEASQHSRAINKHQRFQDTGPLVIGTRSSDVRVKIAYTWDSIKASAGLVRQRAVP